MRIAIVNDTKMTVEGLRRLIVMSNEHELAWIAYDGEEAVRKCAEDTPDLILMDLIMPVLNGVEATSRIMAETPCPILLVTASITSNSSMVFDAMGAGALDVVNTPTISLNGESNENSPIMRKISAIRKLTTGKVEKVKQKSNISTQEKQTDLTPLVAIGSSTGGPSVLAEILGALPEDFPASIVIIQHVDEHFSQELANWLNNQCKLPVKTASDGDYFKPGIVYLASTNDHLVLSPTLRLRYTAEPVANVYRPSVDVFFESVVAYWKGETIGVLLTGMGRDGAEGMLSFRNKGIYTIAQNEESCAVYGMPKAAVQLDAVDDILDRKDIAQALIDRINKITNKVKSQTG